MDWWIQGALPAHASPTKAPDFFVLTFLTFSKRNWVRSQCLLRCWQPSTRNPGSATVMHPEFEKKRCPMGPWFRKKGAHIANNTFENRKLLKNHSRLIVIPFGVLEISSHLRFHIICLQIMFHQWKMKISKCGIFGHIFKKIKNKKCRYAKYFVGLSCSGCIPVLCMDSYCGLFVLVDIA